MTINVFEAAQLGGIMVKNRIVRSATFEGMADEGGRPTEDYVRLYEMLSRKGLGAIITGFAYTSPAGKAMQPGQAGIHTDEVIPTFKKVTKAVHRSGCRIFLQICHAGRQTVTAATGQPVVGVSNKKSPYFGGRPRALSDEEVIAVREEYGDAARRACEAGFDGVQIHAAHGYLIHQFILPSINTRSGPFGIHPEYGIGTALLGSVIDNIKTKCGAGFPLLIKVSRGDDYLRPFTPVMFRRLIEYIDEKDLDGIEVSYGTMDNALNIFRGRSLPVKAILKHNPKFKTGNPLLRFVLKNLIFPVKSARLKPLSPMYNLPEAAEAKALTTIPIISVGGFRSGTDITRAIQSGRTDFAGICRPLLRDPEFVLKFKANPAHTSTCSGCNTCAVLCDSVFPTGCYGPGRAGRSYSSTTSTGERL